MPKITAFENNINNDIWRFISYLRSIHKLVLCEILNNPEHMVARVRINFRHEGSFYDFLTYFSENKVIFRDIWKGIIYNPFREENPDWNWVCPLDRSIQGMYKWSIEVPIKDLCKIIEAMERKREQWEKEGND